jgi:hypothetical protein
MEESSLIKDDENLGLILSIYKNQAFIFSLIPGFHRDFLLIR